MLRMDELFANITMPLTLFEFSTQIRTMKPKRSSCLLKESTPVLGRIGKQNTDHNIRFNQKNKLAKMSELVYDYKKQKSFLPSTKKTRNF